jgi:hypothetical protein
MAFRIKNSSELKYYLYISTSKLEMLYQQVASSGKDKKSVEWGVDLKAVKFIRKGEAEDEPDRDDKLKLVLQALDDADLVGTIEEPKEYVKGTLPMRWGLLRDWGRPTEEPPLVYFGARTETTVFGFGGSSRHVIGNAGASATGSRSVTPYLIAHLLDGLAMSREGWGAYQKYDSDDDFDTFSAVKMATDHLKGPEQNLEFYTKTLLRGKLWGSHGQVGTKVFLGSPLYVAMASPYPEDLSNY